MRRRNFGRLYPLVGGVLLLIALVIAVVIILLPNGSVSVAAVPASVLPLGTKVPPTPTAIPTATPSPSPTPIPPTATPQPTATMPPTATPTPIPTPTPVPDLGIVPSRLRIPSIGVDASVEKVGKTSDGAMDVPKNIWDVAWYDLGIKPGNPGNAVIDGHLDGYNIPAAVFYNLRSLHTGDKIYVSDSSGKELIFAVTQLQVYPYNGAPLDQIFGRSDKPHLNLITCNGTWDYKSQNYNERLIVYTTEVSA